MSESSSDVSDVDFEFEAKRTGLFDPLSAKNSKRIAAAEELISRQN